MLVSTLCPVTLFKLPFFLTGVSGTYCIKYFEICSVEPDVDLLLPPLDCTLVQDAPLPLAAPVRATDSGVAFELATSVVSSDESP